MHATAKHKSAHARCRLVRKKMYIYTQQETAHTASSQKVSAVLWNSARLFSPSLSAHLSSGIHWGLAEKKTKNEWSMQTKGTAKVRPAGAARHWHNKGEDTRCHASAGAPASWRRITSAHSAMMKPIREQREGRLTVQNHRGRDWRSWRLSPPPPLSSAARNLLSFLPTFLPLPFFLFLPSFLPPWRLLPPSTPLSARCCPDRRTLPG